MNTQEQQAYKLGQRKVLGDLLVTLMLHKKADKVILNFVSNYEVKDFQEIIWPEG